MTQALCAHHPEVASTFTCDRCGRFGCASCEGGGGLCTECFVRSSAGSSSALAKVGLALGMLGTCTLLPGVAALFIGFVERRRIAEGRSPPTGLPLARGAIILGWVSIAGMGAVALWALSRALEG
ncbi:MAG TPA: DUF4190 domain-containing protein [Myxococcaceae bacterium]|nr:DUF4190 domain-containing protein [Myxococcaceae bacterium]